MAGENILILGATSAIAERFARLRAGQGETMLLVARNGPRLEAVASDLRARGTVVRTLELDLADPPGGYGAAFDSMAATLGSIDLVLLAYGSLGEAQGAATDPDEAVRIIHTNMTSACAWLMAAAAYMERRGCGTLAAITSVAGDRGRRSNFVYGAAKGGLSVLLQGLAHRFAGTGVRVLDVKPGPVDTPMTSAMKKGALWSRPEVVAADIERAIRSGRPVTYTPWFWSVIMRIIRLLPRPLFNRMEI